MRTAKPAEEYLNNSVVLLALDNTEKNKIIEIINQSRIEVLTAAMNVVKTYKVGNGGSWMDAAVDRTPIIDLIKQIQNQ